jgi:hypothetical protein
MLPLLHAPPAPTLLEMLPVLLPLAMRTSWLPGVLNRVSIR